MASRKNSKVPQATTDGGAVGGSGFGGGLPPMEDGQGVHDAEGGADFDHSLPHALESQEPPKFSITAFSLIEGALFPAKPSPDRSPDAPQMTGSLRIDDLNLRVPVAGFVTAAKESGELYFRLSIGYKDGVRYYGRLFAASRREHANAPDYSGFVVLLPVDHKGQYSGEEWEAAPTLRIRGYRRRNAVDNRARIHLFGAPVSVRDDELPL